MTVKHTLTIRVLWASVRTRTASFRGPYPSLGKYPHPTADVISNQHLLRLTVDNYISSFCLLLPIVSNVLMFVIEVVFWCSVQLTSIFSTLYLDMVLFAYCFFFMDSIRIFKMSQFWLVFQMYLLHVSRTDNINFMPWTESFTDAPSSSLFAHLFVRYSVPVTFSVQY